MRIALDTQGNRIDAKDAIIGKVYTCPVCGESVLLKASTSKSIRPHFAHRPNNLCDTWNSDMSDWHYNWQEKFPVECREVILERDGIRHRADVLINNRVIEFQHSHISEEEFVARNEFYLGCGKKLIWIFDVTNKIKSIFRNDAAIPTNRNGILKLARARSYLENYKRSDGYSIFFQDGDNLFWIFGEEFGEFICFNPEVCLTPEAFLKDFGCTDNTSTKSISELYREECDWQRNIQESIETIGKKMAARYIEKHGG